MYDLFPTILSLSGIDVPSKHVVDGKKLDTLLTAKPDSARDESFLMHYPHSPHRTEYFTVYREGEWKVIYHYFPSDVSEQSHYQLFHLKADPFEQSNLAPSNPKELGRMMRSLVAALENQQAVYPVDEDRKPMRPKLP